MEAIWTIRLKKERKSWEENISNAFYLFIYLVVTPNLKMLTWRSGAVVTIPPEAIFFFVYFLWIFFFFRVIFLSNYYYITEFTKQFKIYIAGFKLVRWAWLPRQPDHLMFYKPHSDARKKIPAKMREVV